MQIDLTFSEIVHLAHCAKKMTALAEKSNVIADALDIDHNGRASLVRITKKMTAQVEKYLHNPATSTQQPATSTQQ